MNLIKITASLSGPTARTSPLNLDGILVAAKTRGHPVPQAAQPAPVLPPLPVMRVDCCGQPCFMTSDLLTSGEPKHYPAFLTRRRSVPDVEWAGKKFMQDGGPKKNKLKRFPIISVNEVYWYAFGDASKVDQLLKNVQSIGSYRAHGYGRVTGWNVETVESIASEPGNAVFNASGFSRRAIPAAWFADMHEVFIKLPCRPPNWHPANITDCLPRGKRGILNREPHDRLFPNAA